MSKMHEADFGEGLSSDLHHGDTDVLLTREKTLHVIPRLAREDNLIYVITPN